MTDSTPGFWAEFFKTLIERDHQLFVKINSDWTGLLADKFFPFITDIQHNSIFVGIWAAILLYWLWKSRLFALKWIFAIAISVAFTDLFAARVMKPVAARARPPQSGVVCVVRGPIHTGNSFPSNHASNSFAVATAVAGLSTPLSIPFFIFALIICYSRVYVGAHFPLDVVMGAAVGILIANIVLWILRKWLRPEPIKRAWLPSRGRSSNRSS